MGARTLAFVLLATWLGLVINGAAQAADWRNLGAEAGTQVFLDEGSITTAGPGTEAVVLVNFSAVRTLGDDWFAHRSRLIRYKVVCATGETALESWSFKSEEFGGGATVWNGTPATPRLARPAEDTVESRLLARLCSTPLASLQR